MVRSFYSVAQFRITESETVQQILFVLQAYGNERGTWRKHGLRIP